LERGVIPNANASTANVVTISFFSMIDIPWIVLADLTRRLLRSCQRKIAPMFVATELHRFQIKTIGWAVITAASEKQNLLLSSRLYRAPSRCVSGRRAAA